MAPKKDDKTRQPVKKVTQDTRFAHVQEDPRFMRPKKSHSKVKVDQRFAHMVKDKDFIESTKIDRYGRAHEDNRAETYLRNTYDFSGSGSEAESESESGESPDGAKVSDKDAESESESGSGSGSGSGSSEGEGDDDVAADIDRARGRGVDSDGSSDSEDDSDISDVEWGVLDGDDAGLSDVMEDPDNIPRGDETRRFACVNMDWEHVRAVDLLAVFVGFKPDSGSVLSVKIYPSEFGKERMAREAVEGPPRELLSGLPRQEGKKDDSGSDSGSESEVDLVKEQVKNQDEFDQIALRRYEIERMRYYFAVVECDSVETAHTICQQCDGTEYEASANFFDMRFIPDELIFEDAPKDEAVDVPEKYEPVSFSTQAMQHSKVKLTWDEDEPSRTQVTRRAFTQDEIDNMDFGNLLASSSDGSSSDEDELARKRALLLSGADKDSDDSDSDDGKMGEMEITFTPGLSEGAASRMAGKKQAEEEAVRRSDETTIDRFRRQKKERREKWKEAKKSGKPSGKDNDSDNLISDNDLDDRAGDSFFTYSDDDLESKTSKESKDGKRESKSERKERQEADAKQRAELELLLDGAEGDRKHFDLSEIVKAEKQKGRKGKHAKKVEVEDEFKLNTSDPRFGALYESHNFAIDPNNPNFKKTKAMKELLNESRKRRKTTFD
ncbi:hypothetical protein BX661DRAFT_183838 [Kickxella alabastrina]|uniref:uncharacterized protein n=1 Tax=Kickxella alabastrina TaxID=61397 RepID=UPI00221FBB78|nr:uncharacterized protein BX661DRAFT_183838 [Kickxella alabastrina]KAI7826353.1 hypothetical protein BX661DRAFT_183838 [Kickxella alabastrina]